MPISRLDYKSLAAPALAKAPFAGVQARAFIASGLLTYQGPAGPEPIPAGKRFAARAPVDHQHRSLYGADAESV